MALAVVRSLFGQRRPNIAPPPAKEAAEAAAAEAARPTWRTPIDITGLELDDSVTRGGYIYYNIYVYGTDKRPGSHMNEYEWKVSMRYSELFAFNQILATHNQRQGSEMILELTRILFPPKIYTNFFPEEFADRQQNLSIYLSELSEFIPRMVDFPWRNFWSPKSEDTPIVPDNREGRALEIEREIEREREWQRRERERERARER